MIPTPETRKTHTKMIVESSSDYLNKITNSSNISASILVVLTLIIEILTILYILLGSVNKFFYISIAFWFIVIVLNFYFNGCIITKIQRHLWNNNKWCGPWAYLFNYLKTMNTNANANANANANTNANTNNEITEKISKNIFNCWIILLVLFILLKIIYSI